MEYIYFQLDKNPRQVKKLSLSSIDIDMRIEWNTRSKCWYVLGYVGDDLVLRNTKVVPNQMYSFDLDSDYDIPYRFMITTEYKNYNWDTNTLFMLFEDNMNKIDEGLTEEGYLVDRRIGTTSDTHSKVKLKSEYNNYLFDVVKVSSDAGVTITCVGAIDSFTTIGLPQGRWDFSINGKRHVTADETAMIEMLTEYGIIISDIGNGEYSWSNTTDVEVKIEGYYPYAVGYPLTLNLESNETLRVLSKDDNNWVNRFTVCLSSFVDTVWEVYKTDISDDYNNFVFRARKSLTGVKPTKEEALIVKYKSGLDPYSVILVDELTGVSDWVLDSENNQIKYKQTSEGTGSYICSRYAFQSNSVRTCGEKWVQSSNENSYGAEDWEITSCNETTHVCTFTDKKSGSIVTANVVSVVNTQPIEEQKTLPLEVLAQKVISNAANGDVNAQDLLNTLNKYDSYAEVEILPFVVESLSDVNMQNWNAVTTAIGELTGASSWTFDNADKKILYESPPDPTVKPNAPYVWQVAPTGNYYLTEQAAIDALIKYGNQTYPDYTIANSINKFCPNPYLPYSSTNNCSLGSQSIIWGTGHWSSYIYLYYAAVSNPEYDPSYVAPTVSITYQQVADKIIANSNVEDEGVSLLAQAYLQEVSHSVPMGDVESQFNSNIYNFGVKDVIIEHVNGGIKSTWVSFGFPENVSYYRSNTTMNPDSMPSPLTTGLKDLNSFTEQVIINTRQYIRFGTIKNNREVISEEFIIEPPLNPLTDINFEVIR